MDYTDLDWCVQLILEELGLATQPKNVGIDLDGSAGTDPEGTPYYRPYLYLAEHVDTRDNQEAPQGTKNVSLRDYDKRVIGYLKKQARLDAQYSLTVPPGTEVVVPDNVSGRLQSSSVPITVVF